MTEPGATPVPDATPRGGTLGLRLALAFLAVALAAADVSNLASQQRAELAKAIAAVAGAVWDRNNTWSGANVSAILDLAAPTGTAVQIRDQAGRIVVTSRGFGAKDGAQSSLAIVVDGEQVGTALVRSTGSGLAAADRSLKTALLRAIAGAAGLAALVALLTGLAVARRITRPVTRLIAATRAMAAGDRTARVGEIHAAGSCASWRPPSTRWLAPWTGRSRSAGTWSPTSPTSCAPRSPSSRRGTRRCSTAWPSPPRPNSARCATRCCGWRAWWVTCRRWPPPTPPCST